MRLTNAVEAGATDRVRELLRRGADPEWGTPGCLIGAAERLDADVVEALLQDGRADVTRTDQGSTALGFALYFAPDAPDDEKAQEQVGAMRCPARVLPRPVPFFACDDRWSSLLCPPLVCRVACSSQGVCAAAGCCRWRAA